MVVASVAMAPIGVEFGRECSRHNLGHLNEMQKQQAPDHVWQLLDWAWRGTLRGAVVIVEWQATRVTGGNRFDWRGVDKFTLIDAKIMEERVYQDTAPLRARRTGEKLEPLIRI